MRYKEALLEELKNKLRRLYPLENQEMLLHMFFKKWLIRLLGILGSVVFIIVIMLLTATEEEYLTDGSRLNRPDYNEEPLEVQIKTEIQERGAEPEEITLQIEPEKYTLEEFEQLVKASIPKLEKSILGNNLSVDEIDEDLFLPEYLYDTPIEIIWKSDKEEIITRNGKLNVDRNQEEEVVVSLTAMFIYEKYKMSHTIGLKVKAVQLSEPERLKKLLYEEIEEIFETSKEDSEISLPREIDGKEVLYKEEKTDNRNAVIFFVITGFVLWGIAIKEELESLEKKRQKQLLMDYPALISQFTLLLSAGMTISGAWKKIIGQYEMQRERGWKKRRYVYEEMIITWREMQNGIAEVEAISRFGTRIRLVPYLKFSALLSQNIRKGSRGLISLLKVEEKMAYEDRKEIAKQLGEEAGTKLLIPMFMMFGIVLAVILVPAFSNF